MNQIVKTTNVVTKDAGVENVPINEDDRHRIVAVADDDGSNVIDSVNVVRMRNVICGVQGHIDSSIRKAADANGIFAAIRHIMADEVPVSVLKKTTSGFLFKMVPVAQGIVYVGRQTFGFIGVGEEEENFRGANVAEKEGQDVIIALDFVKEHGKVLVKVPNGIGIVEDSFRKSVNVCRRKSKKVGRVPNSKKGLHIKGSEEGRKEGILLYGRRLRRNESLKRHGLPQAGLNLQKGLKL